MALINAARYSLGITEFIGREPLRPYNLSVHEAAINSANADPPPSKRTRWDTPGQYGPGAPWTGRQGAQRARLWLHRSDDWPYESGISPGPYATGAFIHLRTGVFHRHHRDHLNESAEARYFNLYGFGKCRAKELNGQITMGYPCLYRFPRVGEEIVYTNTVPHPEETECNGAQLGSNGTYKSCEGSSLDNDRYFIGKDNSGVRWKTYVRMPLPVPQGATIVDARMTFYMRSHAPVPIPCVISALASDDVDDYATGDPANTYGTIAESDLFNFFTDAEAGDPYVVPINLAPQIQAIVNRPGFEEDNHCGLVVESVGDLNDGDMHIIAEPIGIPTVRLAIRYRTGDYNPNGIATRPPILRGYQHYYTHRTHDPTYGPEMEEEPIEGGIDRDAFWHKMPDYRAGAEYKFMYIAPVPPISAWHDDTEHGDPLYGEDAHLAPFIFNDCGTYEVPCPRRYSPPYRYQSLNNSASFIQPDVRAIVAHADKPPKPGIEPIYNSGCVGDEGKTFGLQENLIQRYEGRTATKRHVHPDNEDWWIEYTGYIKAWLVYGDERDFLRMADPGSDPDSYGAFIHWNCWWEVQIVAKFDGPSQELEPEAWAEFAEWVNTHESRFGATVTPKTLDQCNDILLRCADVPCALGDIQRPTEEAQDDCEDIQEEGRRLPCREAGNYSWWYLPTLGSNHPVTTLSGPVVPLLPEYGLWHEFRRVAKHDPAGLVESVDTGWCSAGFQSNHPVIKGAIPVEDVFPVTRKEQWIPFKSINGEALNFGSMQVRFTDTYDLLGFGVIVPPLSFDSGTIFSGDDAATVQALLEVAFGAGNISVVKASSSPDTYEIEFIGALTGYNHQVSDGIEAVGETYFTDPENEFEFERTLIREGQMGGLNDP